MSPFRSKLTPWDQLTAEEQEEVRREFDTHVQKGGAHLEMGLYRNVTDDDRGRGARGKWVMAYC